MIVLLNISSENQSKQSLVLLSSCICWVLCAYCVSWHSDGVSGHHTVLSGFQRTVKLSSPAKACPSSVVCPKPKNCPANKAHNLNPGRCQNARQLKCIKAGLSCQLDTLWACSHHACKHAETQILAPKTARPQFPTILQILYGVLKGEA